MKIVKGKLGSIEYTDKEWQDIKDTITKVEDPELRLSLMLKLGI